MKRILVMGVVVVTIFVLATSTTLAIRQSRRHRCQTVMVSKVDIPSGTELNPLIAAGDFESICENGLVVSDPVRSLNELNNQTTSAAIYANEQIPLDRLDIG
jgi:Flp pilus assembly protein CpaB